MTVRPPSVNCDPGLGSVCLPAKPRRYTGGPVAIDLFAGAGGFSTGAEAAGVQVVFAINHNKVAIANHAVNHPYTHHRCEDVFRFDFNEAFDLVEETTGHSTPDLILSSPSCVVHSTARSRGGGIGKRGGRTSTISEDRQRATPEATAHATLVAMKRSQAERRKPPFLLVENVAEIRSDWPFYRGWKLGLEDLGYTSKEYLIEALDFGVAAERERLFVLFTPTAISKKPFDLKLPAKRVLGDATRWTEKIKVPKACQLGSHLVRDFGSAGWGAISELSAPHQAKFQYNLAKAESMNGGQAPEYWTYMYATGTKPRFVEHPQRTITAEIGGQLYVVHSRGRQHFERPVLMEELRGWFGFPGDYLLPATPSAAGKLVGNAVVPAVAEWIVRQIVERL